MAHYFKSKFLTMFEHWKNDLENFILALRKGVMSYEDFDSWDKYKETSLPPKLKLFSKLKNTAISDGDYKHTLRVYQIHNKKDLSEYKEVYCFIDGMKLIAVEENFIMNMHERFKLDPLSFVMFPSLSCEPAIKMTTIELELLM